MEQFEIFMIFVVIENSNIMMFDYYNLQVTTAIGVQIILHVYMTYLLFKHKLY